MLLAAVDVAPQTTLRLSMDEPMPQTTLVAPHTTELLVIALAPHTTEFPQTTEFAPQTTLEPPKAEVDVFTIVTTPVSGLRTAVGERANPFARSVLLRAASMSRYPAP